MMTTHSVKNVPWSKAMKMLRQIKSHVKKHGLKESDVELSYHESQQVGQRWYQIPKAVCDISWHFEVK